MSKLEATELTKEIYEKYPKVWRKLRNKYYVESLFKKSFSMFYGPLEDFFEENGLVIDIFTNPFTDIYIAVSILENGEGRFMDMRYETKQEAKQQAILKACEILEGRLVKTRSEYE